MKKIMLCKILIGSIGFLGVCGVLATAIINTDSEKKVKEDTSTMYEYGKCIKENGSLAENIFLDSNGLSESAIQAYADVFGETNEERNELKEEKTKKVTKEREDYLKAIEKGYSASEEEIEAEIEKTKEAIKGTDAEDAILEFCKGADLTEAEYWEKMRDAYEVSIVVHKYKTDLAIQNGFK